MISRGAPLPDAVVALLARCLPPLVVQLAARAADAGQSAGLVIGAGRDVDLPEDLRVALHDAGGGHRCAVVDELTARVLTAIEHLELAPAWNAPLEAGEVWCLVLAEEGGFVVAAALAASWTTRSRGPAN